MPAAATPKAINKCKSLHALPTHSIQINRDDIYPCSFVFPVCTSLFFLRVANTLPWNDTLIFYVGAGNEVCESGAGGRGGR